MTIAVWDYPAADLLARGFSSEHTVIKDTQRGCTARLHEGDVDVALIPTLQILRSPDSFDPLAGVAFSSWRYPYARLVLQEPLSTSLDSVAFDPVYAQEVLLTRIVLKEHYDFEPSFIPLKDPSVDELLAADAAASLVVGPNVPFLQPDEYAMDVGQEWYELSKYPMIWGLFAARADEATPEMVSELVDGTHRAQRERPSWIQSQETTPAMHRFYSDDLRIHLDDMAVAGLTALSEQLFYHDVIDDMSGLQFVEAPSDEDEDEPASDRSRSGPRGRGRPGRSNTGRSDTGRSNTGHSDTGRTGTGLPPDIEGDLDI